MATGIFLIEITVILVTVIIDQINLIKMRFATSRLEGFSLIACLRQHRERKLLQCSSAYSPVANHILNVQLLFSGAASMVLYHTWVWNRGICMCVIVRPRSHMLIVLKSNPWYNKIWLCLNVTFWSYFHSFCYNFKISGEKIALIHTFFNHKSLVQLIFVRL